jgi:hypothetical protein
MDQLTSAGYIRTRTGVPVLAVLYHSNQLGAACQAVKLSYTTGSQVFFNFRVYLNVNNRSGLVHAWRPAASSQSIIIRQAPQVLQHLPFKKPMIQ